MKLKDLVRQRPWKRDPAIPTPRSVGAAIFEHHAERLQRDTQEALEAIYAGRATSLEGFEPGFTMMVRDHREGFVRRLNEDIKIIDLIDRLQKLELIRELSERHPELVAAALNPQTNATTSLTAKKLNSGEEVPA